MSVLVVQHEEECPPAWFGVWILEAGVALDVRKPYVGEALPDDLPDEEDPSEDRPIADRRRQDRRNACEART